MCPSRNLCGIQSNNWIMNSSSQPAVLPPEGKGADPRESAAMIDRERFKLLGKAAR
jgi:hypothetical protein